MEGFEGTAGKDRSPAQLAAVDAYLDELRALTVRLADEGLFAGDRPVLVSAGGSKFFDRVIRALGRDADFGGHACSLVLRSGCYLIHDHGVYAVNSPLGREVPEKDRLQPAIEIWAEVLSVPSLGSRLSDSVGATRRSTLGCRFCWRAVGRDERTLRQDVAGQLVKLDDQHGYLAVDPDTSGLRAGDRLVFGISHPVHHLRQVARRVLLDREQRVIRVLQTRFH